ncbi:hypothetical protein [Bacteroides finegoldii]|uniref:hypothetical protein n=1 Tax=Bacteroides finegoldii TaxID=338188 RepID=UPI0018A10D29|nr:hypothetical protein [Bacteroides finegoldii]
MGNKIMPFKVWKLLSKDTLKKAQPAFDTRNLEELDLGHLGIKNTLSFPDSFE